MDQEKCAQRSSLFPHPLFIGIMDIICMYGHTYTKSKDQPGNVANPARDQLKGKNIFSLSPFAPVSRDDFGSPIPRQPAHVQAESGSYLRDSSRFPRRRPLFI